MFDNVFKSVFWLGLDNHLYQQAPAAAFPGTFASYLDHVLWLSGSALTVGEAEDDITTQPHTPAILIHSPAEPALHASPAEPVLHARSAEPKAVCVMPAAPETVSLMPARNTTNNQLQGQP